MSQETLCKRTERYQVVDPLDDTAVFLEKELGLLSRSNIPLGESPSTFGSKDGDVAHPRRE